VSGALEGRTYLVTGASSGIGRACARAIGAAGGNVVATGRRRERLDEVVESIGATRAVAATGDAREEAVAKAWVDRAVERYGGLDGLVNAAGIIAPGGIVETEPAEWDRMMDVNLRGLYLVTRAATPRLIERKGSVAARVTR